jgi:hypothetical protein
MSRIMSDDVAPMRGDPHLALALNHSTDTPYTPVAASVSANAANRPSSVALNFRDAMVSPTIVSLAAR